MGRFGAHVLLLSILLQWIVKSKGQSKWKLHVLQINIGIM